MHRVTPVPAEELLVWVLVQLLLTTVSNFLWNCRNGRWRSEWRVPAYVEGHKKESSGTHECTGDIRLQVHYFEDGNVQLISQKEAKLDLKFTVSFL